MKKRCRVMTLGGPKDDSEDIRRDITTLTIKNLMAKEESDEH